VIGELSGEYYRIMAGEEMKAEDQPGNLKRYYRRRF
jgi:hypothetical protein